MIAALSLLQIAKLPFLWASEEALNHLAEPIPSSLSTSLRTSDVLMETITLSLQQQLRTSSDPSTH
jgi:hypothetical protein